MGWSRVSAASVVAVGDRITLKVLRVDDGGKIALGLKQLQDDPWSKVQATYAVGQVRDGRVTRVADFGAFVELEPGVEALAHVSTFPPAGRAGGWAKSVSVGMTGAFTITAIDLEKKRIGVAPVAEGPAARDAQEAADVHEYHERADANASEAFGTMAAKLRGALGTRQD
jgi:ribosomal protein S1